LPVIDIEAAWRAAFETRLARQRLKAAGRTVTMGCPWKRTLDLWPSALGVGLKLLQNAAMSVGADCSPEIAARKSEISLQHAGHLVDVLAQGFRVRDCHRSAQFKLEAGENGAQIMRHAASMAVRCSIARSNCAASFQ